VPFGTTPKISFSCGLLLERGVSKELATRGFLNELGYGKYSATEEDTMNLMQLIVAVPTALFVLGNGGGTAGQTIDHIGAYACVSDKWGREGA
jgi:hypothetical protein